MAHGLVKYKERSEITRNPAICSQNGAPTADNSSAITPPKANQIVVRLTEISSATIANTVTITQKPTYPYSNTIYITMPSPFYLIYFI
jgi:hypothetical protein